MENSSGETQKKGNGCKPMRPRMWQTAEFWYGFILGAVLSGLIFRFVL